ncbi:hypothetical protein B484DRAFT_440866, partial [Ochromonadaceae sp. CCMP2298]
IMDQQQQQGGLQTASQDTADSSLDWGEDVSYHWLVVKVGLPYADVCGVLPDDHHDILRLVAFHYEDGTRYPDSLADSVPDFLRSRRDDGLRPPTLRAVYIRIRNGWTVRYTELPAVFAAQAPEILRQHAQSYEQTLAGPLTLAELHY